MTDSPQPRFRLPHWGWFLLGTVVLAIAEVGLSVWLPWQREHQIVKNIEGWDDQDEPAESAAVKASQTDAEPTDSRTDFDLIELVLVDLMDFTEFSPTGFDGKSQIVLNEKTNGPSWSISDGQLNSESRNTTEPHIIPAEICADLRRRNSKEPISLSDLKPKNPKILVEDLSDINLQDFFAFEKKYPDAKGYVAVWSPGYSKDGKTAVVTLWFGPTPHGAKATYMLVKKDGRWTFKWRRTVEYV